MDQHKCKAGSVHCCCLCWTHGTKYSSSVSPLVHRWLKVDQTYIWGIVTLKNNGWWPTQAFQPCSFCKYIVMQCRNANCHSVVSLMAVQMLLLARALNKSKQIMQMTSRYHRKPNTHSFGRLMSVALGHYVHTNVAKSRIPQP